MSELGSAVTAAVATDVTQLSDDELREDLMGLPEQLTSLKAAWLKRVREAERRQIAQVDGHRSVGGRLRAHTLCSRKDASGAAWLARRLQWLPVTLAALEAGEIAESHAKQISFLAKDVDRDVMAEAETNLVQAAREMDHTDFRGLIDRLRTQWLPLTTAAEEEDAHQRRSFSIGERYGNLVPVQGWLEVLTAEKLQTVLNSLSTPDSADVPEEARRTPVQRRHDALDQALSRLLDAGELPTVRREKPHISLTADLGELLRGVGTAELDWSGPLDISLAEMLLCDANVHPIITHGGPWTPAALLEDQDTASKKLWRYLRVRDGHCRFPGCDIPAVWCDAHHICWVSHHGETSNDNCVLLCKYHHRIVHRQVGPWRIKGDPETILRFISPTAEIHSSPATGRPRCL